VRKRASQMAAESAYAAVIEASRDRWRQRARAASRLELTRDITKTDAGVGVIPMVPGLRKILPEHRMTRPFRAEDHVFATRNPRPNTPDNARSTIIDAARERANALPGERDEQPIGHLTPHSLRRTLASMLAELGGGPRRAMYLLGHTDAKFTMGVYKQVLDIGKDGIATLEAALGGFRCSVPSAPRCSRSSATPSSQGPADHLRTVGLGPRCRRPPPSEDPPIGLSRRADSSPTDGGTSSRRTSSMAGRSRRSWRTVTWVGAAMSSLLMRPTTSTNHSRGRSTRPSLTRRWRRTGRPRRLPAGCGTPGR